jgi:hypothetical protein
MSTRTVPSLTAGLLVILCAVGCAESNPQPSPGAGDTQRVPTGADAASLADVTEKTDAGPHDLVAADNECGVQDLVAADDGCGFQDLVAADGKGDAPEATPEMCNGMDDDCDGEVDEECGQCFDSVCADVLCAEDCGNPACAIDCCDGSCFLCPKGGRCIDGKCCMPACKGKVCGPDGCGGSCGKCPDWHECQDGQCVVDNPCGVDFEGEVGCGGCTCEECTCETDPYCCDHPWDATCVKTCTNECGGCEPCVGECFEQECGSDGCGGSCGACPSGKPFCLDGHCQADCTPDCEGKSCGDDGCGGSCGTCPDLEFENTFSTMIQGCEADGQCHCVRCIYSFFEEPYSCEGDCQIMFDVPDCSGKECGPDGFGGSCGKCGWGAECGPKGQCVCAFP